MSMTRLALRQDRAVAQIERGEQGGGAVTLVIMGDVLNIAQPDRQHRLGAFERLDPRLRGGRLWLFSSTQKTSALSGGLR